VLASKRIGGRSQALVAVAVQLCCALDHVVRRSVQRAP
jgi:hypothetical protein